MNPIGQIIPIVAARLRVREGLVRIETVFDALHPGHSNYGVTIKSEQLQKEIRYVSVFSLNKM